jgi:hypothetical protein
MSLFPFLAEQAQPYHINPAILSPVHAVHPRAKLGDGCSGPLNAGPACGRTSGGDRVGPSRLSFALEPKAEGPVEPEQLVGIFRHFRREPPVLEGREAVAQKVGQQGALADQILVEEHEVQERVQPLDDSG